MTYADMTFNGLQDRLLEEITDILKDMVTYTADGNKRVGFKGYKNLLPPIRTDEESEEQFFPYFIIRLYSGKTQDDEDCWHVTSDIVLGVYENGNAGHERILTAIQRIVNRFTEDPLMGCFRADQDIEWVMEEEGREPYYFGGVSITFSVPKILRRIYE